MICGQRQSPEDLRRLPRLRAPAQAIGSPYKAIALAGECDEILMILAGLCTRIREKSGKKPVASVQKTPVRN
jgi:hypothetical protein